MDPKKEWRRLMEGNERFVRGERKAHDLVRRREELLEGQKPAATVVCCSDSRVVPEIIFDANLGDLFTVESAGNVVDEVALGTIEYGVEHLKTPLLLILGHTRCGAVTACCRSGEKVEGHLGAVLRRIEPAAAMRGREVDLSIEENVRRVRDLVLEQSDHVREAIKRGDLLLVTALYRLETGTVVPIA